ncbi:hypothetical protein [Caldisericum exile]|uniref:DUF4900 domain-containing protein n=1 Tax=Caldisericum exile (strain DSM 21853 / NBRC 104410 / AZM16c01) TaxID=511051 RepID=A0A7U6GFH3_CALEA|nr:hypothetical protein [Caldisericum exile]BAL81452.1 hypothetical protein CSE_13260 [Caldisericum exile AZM16c01]
MKRKGFSMIFTILIAAMMMIPVLMLFSSATTRNFTSKGEIISDRALVVADAAIENILNTINTFGFPYSSPQFEDENQQEALVKARDYAIADRLSELNGGVADINDPIGSYNRIINNISTYIFKSDESLWFAVWDVTNNKIASVSSVGPDGDIAVRPIKNLTTGDIYNGGISEVDPNYKSDNLWFEIDTNTQYWPGNPDKWVIRATSYNISKPEIYRSIETHASRGQLSVTPTSTISQLANGNWYVRSTDSDSTTVYYSDFSGLYHTKVYFGQFEVTKGIIRSDNNLYMGGWAQDPVFASGRVYDQAIDAGWAHTGRFGPNQNNLSWAKNNGYAKDEYPQAQWPNGDLALKGSTPVRNPSDPNGGLQDKASPDYYISGNATIVFVVENGVGKVVINGVKKDLPPNGAIYVEGTATVSGTIKGRVTVGAGNNINIGGNILYDTPPRIEKDIPINGTPDALGLVAYNNIYIPYSTFKNYPHLEVDAAMMAVHGSFGVTNDYPWRPMDTSGKYFAKWYGAQAEWSTDNAPCIVNGNYVKGYEIQQTFYDYNLFDFGAPPFYPTTNSRSEVHWNTRYEVVTDANILSNLRKLEKSNLIQINPSDPDYDPNYPYKYVYQGVTYYYGTVFDVSVKYSAKGEINKSPLYRIIWKENIAQKVKP